MENSLTQAPGCPGWDRVGARFGVGPGGAGPWRAAYVVFIMSPHQNYDILEIYDHGIGNGTLAGAFWDVLGLR